MVQTREPLRRLPAPSHDSTFQPPTCKKPKGFVPLSKQISVESSPSVSAKFHVVCQDGLGQREKPGMPTWPQKSGQNQQGESGEALLTGDPSVMGEIFLLLASLESPGK